MPVRVLCLIILLLWPVSSRAEVDRIDAFRFLDGFQRVKVLTPSQDLTDLSFQGANPDDRFNLVDQHGKWLVLNIWATWCGPCVEELPKLDRLKMMRAAPNFDVLAVSIDLSKSARRISFFLKRWKVNYIRPLYDDLRMTSEKLDTRVLPVTYVINPSGQAVAVLYGPANWGSEGAVNFVDTLQTTPDLFDRSEKHDKARAKP